MITKPIDEQSNQLINIYDNINRSCSLDVFECQDDDEDSGMLYSVQSDGFRYKDFESKVRNIFGMHNSKTDFRNCPSKHVQVNDNTAIDCQCNVDADCGSEHVRTGSKFVCLLCNDADEQLQRSNVGQLFSELSLQSDDTIMHRCCNKLNDLPLRLNLQVQTGNYDDLSHWSACCCAHSDVCKMCQHEFVDACVCCSNADCKCNQSVLLSMCNPNINFNFEVDNVRRRHTDIANNDIDGSCIFAQSNSLNTFTAKPTSNSDNDASKQSDRQSQVGAVTRSHKNADIDTEPNNVPIKHMMQLKNRRLRTNQSQHDKKSRRNKIHSDPSHIKQSEMYDRHQTALFVKCASTNKSSIKSVSEDTDSTKNSKLSSCKVVSDEVVDLATRKDVVNKTVLRCLRRHFTNEYRSCSQDFFSSKVHRSKWYFESIKKFVSSTFSSLTDKQQLLQVQFYIGSIIFPKFLTAEHARECRVDEDLKQVFYDCVYKYSHTKLLSMFKIKPIKLIYQHFYTNAVCQALASESAILKNRNIYEAAFANFNAAFDNRIDALVLVRDN